MLGRFDEAAARFANAVEIAPLDAAAPYNWGKMLKEQGDVAAAEHWLRRSIELSPDLLEAKLVLADLLHESGSPEHAIAILDAILDSRPEHPVASVWRCVFELPVLYRDKTEVSVRRAAYAEQLDILAQRVVSDPRRYLPGFASTRPFFLAYQGQDDRDLQARYGSLVRAVVSACSEDRLSRAAARTRIRLGVVSGYFRLHSVWKTQTRGWLVGLDPERFEIICYHVAEQVDEETDVARLHAARFVQGPKTLDAWVKLIGDDACDVLLYPEVGMDPIAALLAAVRLAPVQCNGLGHPTTSGLSTIDYALSCDLMEVENADMHYTEKVVRLPNTSVYYEYISLPEAMTTRQDMGVPSDRFAFWCGQSLFKYQPVYDDVFAQIASLEPRSFFVFIEFQNGTAATTVFAERLKHAFSSYGLEMENFCVFLPRLSPSAFVAAAGQCDAILDSIGWAGFNSTLEALTHDMPLVTFKGPLMRGCHGAAILSRMGLHEMIATSPKQYVEIACHLAADPITYASIKARVAASKEVLFRDEAPVVALSEFLHSVVHRPLPATAL